MTRYIKLSMLVGCFAFGFVCVVHAQVDAPRDSQHIVKVLVAYHSMTGNTEKMARGVLEGAKSVPGTVVELSRVGEVTADQLFGSDALVVGSPVYWSNMAGEVKTFFDNWQFKFGVYPEFKMRNKVGAAFTTGGQVSSGKEVTMLTILVAMLANQMIVVSESAALGAPATTEGESPGIDETELTDARALGKRVAEVARMVKRGMIPPTSPLSTTSPLSPVEGD